MSGSVWIASYVLLWITVLVLAFAVVVLLRQIGVLHARVRPMGVHHAGQGPPVDAPAPAIATVDFAAWPVTLLVFTSPSCSLCEALLPSLHVLERDYADVRLAVLEHGAGTIETFRAYDVTATPYLVAVDGEGAVRGAGVANTLEQAEVLVEGALAHGEHSHA